MTCHHRCQSLVPRACGQDTHEKRGRIKIGFYTQRLSEDKWRVNIEGKCVERERERERECTCTSYTVHNY